MSCTEVKHIVIVGGGTAGWLTAGRLAADHYNPDPAKNIQITVVESPDIKPIGVGEGTWPSMRETLKTIGISETEFIKECDASFKQGSKFVDWFKTGHYYYHPFTVPASYHEINLANHWMPHNKDVSFTNAVTTQGALCDNHLAPKQITTPEYAFVNNYGYHLDAGKFGPFLQKFCIEKYQVRQILDKVTGVSSHPNGDIRAISTEQSGEISGDLFIDCSGTHGLLINKHFKVPFISQKHLLFNDSALAVQVPYFEDQNTIQSATVSTANSCGWIWDIGLQSRRGTGQVYSSAHCSDEEAEIQLRCYLSQTIGKQSAEQANIRKLSINPGHREKFWVNNCVAIGMAAGFIEPLEASAIALIEQSATYIAQQLPRSRNTMTTVAERFNQKFTNRWQQIIEFLKLHYVLSQRRDSQYWIDNVETIPPELIDKLALWQSQPPYSYDSVYTEELFPSASYQYVYYGMGGVTDICDNRKMELEKAKAQSLFNDNQKKSQHLMRALTNNRELLQKIHQFGLSKI